MTHPTPVLRAYYTAKELMTMLETCLGFSESSAADRCCCLHAFLRLRHVCELWAADQDPDAFEDYYLLLFDALGLLTTAYQMPGERRRLMIAAVQKLYAVQTLYQLS